MTAAVRRSAVDPVAFDDALLDVLGAGHHPRLPGPSRFLADLLCAWRDDLGRELLDAVHIGHHPAGTVLATLTGRTT
ncbi:hypothetical protein [Amycolatopsis eburnea]|uniref:Uncharacterized protein n=1 Tax=Amycolatopsis eburnea TaxID=2267691 RepID=A0A427TPR8_9PSEU|nr:hypothetical protein [Amycolatopsis eburnea]RSD26376.1 hypothetical protein EIY87_00495 [Amycolatopsis eburnea]